MAGIDNPHIDHSNNSSLPRNITMTSSPLREVARNDITPAQHPVSLAGSAKMPLSMCLRKFFRRSRNRKQTIKIGQAHADSVENHAHGNNDMDGGTVVVGDKVIGSSEEYDRHSSTTFDGSTFVGEDSVMGSSLVKIENPGDKEGGEIEVLGTKEKIQMGFFQNKKTDIYGSAAVSKIDTAGTISQTDNVNPKTSVSTPEFENLMNNKPKHKLQLAKRKPRRVPPSGPAKPLPTRNNANGQPFQTKEYRWWDYGNGDEEIEGEGEGKGKANDKNIFNIVGSVS